MKSSIVASAPSKPAKPRPAPKVKKAVKNRDQIGRSTRVRAKVPQPKPTPPSPAPVYRQRNWRPAYLRALAEVGIKTLAQKAAKISKQIVWHERQTNVEFAKKEQEALAMGVELLEDEAVERARVGMKRYRFLPDGTPIMDPMDPKKPYVERVVSDGLLTLLLKSHKREVYGDKIEVKQEGGKQRTREEWLKLLEEADQG